MAEYPNGTNPIRFDQTPDTRFFLCRYCGNHVLSEENFHGYVANMQRIACHNPINVRDADTTWPVIHLNVPVVNVSCNECNRTLGQRFFRVTVLAPNPVILEARFMLFPNEMLLWNGTQLVYADTNQPVVDNGNP